MIQEEQSLIIVVVWQIFLNGIYRGIMQIACGYKKENNRQGRLQWGIQHASKGTMKLMGHS